MNLERAGAACLLTCVLFSPGCTDSVTQLRIESHKPPAPPTLLAQKFPSAWFSWDARGNMDLIFESSQPSEVDAEGRMLQIFWARMFWKPVPGTTFVERTQINANFGYAILDMDRTVSYEGAGFVYMTLDQSQKRMSGSIESGTLARMRGGDAGSDVLGQCLVSGEFTARRDDAKVVELLTHLRQRLGPPPKPTPADPAQDLR